MESIIRSLLLMLLLVCLGGCGDKRKLDEFVFYDGPDFKLKLVRIYRNIPFSYVGETFAILCASSRTVDWSNNDTQEPGWRQLSSGGAIGSTNAKDLADSEGEKYMVINEQTLVMIGTVLSISFDACGSFAMWDPSTLPADMIDPVDKPSYCAPVGGADCRYYDFHGDREPVFEAISIDPGGHISFVVRSKSFKDAAGLRVESSDRGKSWQVTSVGA